MRDLAVDVVLCTYIHVIYVYVFKCVYLFSFTYVCTYVRTYVRKHVRVEVCVTSVCVC